SAGAPGGEGPFSRDPETDISSGRFELYANLFGSIADRPVLGSGYRTTELLPAMQGSGGHNLLLSVTAELGIMGIFWFLAVILVLISGSFLPKSYTAAAALLTGVTIVGVSELTESSILGWGSPTTLLAWLLIFVAAVPLVGPTSEETR
ncbi:MAG: hypothetical protein LH624_09275, partial [Cryobacterium sp.]|nr:hypothetical protein [Cryobacterium sp.]